MIGGLREARLRCMLRGLREARLRCMLSRDSEAYAGYLNDEDRDAIQWAFQRIATLEAELADSRKWLYQERENYTRLRRQVSAAISALHEI